MRLKSQHLIRGAALATLIITTVISFELGYHSRDVSEQRHETQMRGQTAPARHNIPDTQVNQIAKRSRARQLRPIQNGPTDLFSRAARIRTPADFTPFEQVLRDITGEAPVPLTRIRFIPRTRLDRNSDGADGTYSFDYIQLQSELSGETVTARRIAICGNLVPEGLPLHSKLVVYLHEQGHSYTAEYNYLIVDQMEAEAFALGVAERIGVQERMLGLDIIVTALNNQGIFGAQEEHLELLLQRFRSRPIDPNDLAVTGIGILGLLGATDQESFSSVWQQIHTHSNREILARIGAIGINELRSGVGKARNIVNRLAGVDIWATPQIAAFIDKFDLGAVRNTRIDRLSMGRTNISIEGTRYAVSLETQRDGAYNLTIFNSEVTLSIRRNRPEEETKFELFMLDGANGTSVDIREESAIMTRFRVVSPGRCLSQTHEIDYGKMSTEQTVNRIFANLIRTLEPDANPEVVDELKGLFNSQERR
ncbi:hypothetical protein HY990_05800 [Candidatus Micrarchaeota archaeon]|nr:hypothetical protein [Candidatus Micrarchaeota archaeon]